MGNLEVSPYHSTADRSLVADDLNIPRTQPSNAAYIPSTLDSLGLLPFVRMLYRRKITILLITLAGALAAFLLSALQSPVYRSTAVLEVQPPNEDFLNLKDINPTAASQSFSDSSFVKTQADILRQHSSIERVVNKLNLVNKPEFASTPSLVDRIRPWFGAKQAAPLSPQEGAIETVSSRLRVEPSLDSRIINVSYDAQDPAMAADLANTLAETFIESSVQARWNAAREVRQWLQPQLEDLRAKLEQSQGELQNYIRSSGLQLTTGQGNLAEDKLRLVQAELSKAQAERVARQSVYYSAMNGEPESLTDNSVIQQYRLRLTDLRKEAADLNAVLTPQNYKVQRVNAQIQEVEAALKKELTAGMSRLRDEYKAAAEREGMLEKTYNSQWGQVSQISSKMAGYDNLKHQVDTTRQFYEAMMLKANEASIASVIRPSNIRIVSPARASLKPQKPNIPLNLILGTFIGLIFAVGLVTMQDHGVRPLRVPGDAQSCLSLRELGAIPSARTSGMGRLIGAGDGDERLALVSWEKKLSNVSESFRGTVTSILLSSFNHTFGTTVPRALVITSSLPGEGKTTVVTNLAIALAELNRRVVLIDGDLRRPRLHDIFDLPNHRGISTIIRDHSALEVTPIDSLIQKTKVPNLSVVLSGPGTDEISSLLYSARMEKLIRRLRADFDFVLIDVPPSLPYSDGRLLAQFTDGVVLVVRANYANDRVAQTVVQRFQMDGIPILGTILNDWNPRSDNSYGSYGYYDLGLEDSQASFWKRLQL